MTNRPAVTAANSLVHSDQLVVKISRSPMPTWDAWENRAANPARTFTTSAAPGVVNDLARNYPTKTPLCEGLYGIEHPDVIRPMLRLRFTTVQMPRKTFWTPNLCQCGRVQSGEAYWTLLRFSIAFEEDGVRGKAASHLCAVRVTIDLAAQ